MGIDNAAAKMLLISKNIKELDYERPLILGHQKNYISWNLRNQIKREFGVKQHELKADYADNFFSILGMKSFEILDLSPYEGATILHDMNTEVPDLLKGKFSFVIDIGTIEHIYDINQAMKNLQSLCRVGGHILLLTPANNFLGHGFFQISPEFYFRSFDSGSGFQIESFYLIKNRFMRDFWFELIDPELLGRRGTLTTRSKCYIGVIVKKISDNTVTLPKQQSDYVPVWSETKITKYGRVYLQLPRPLRSVLNFTIIPMINKFRSKSLPISFYWSEGKLLTRHSRNVFRKY